MQPKRKPKPDTLAKFESWLNEKLKEGFLIVEIEFYPDGFIQRYGKDAYILITLSTPHDIDDPTLLEDVFFEDVFCREESVAIDIPRKWFSWEKCQFTYVVWC